ncbi:hypothetical protein D3C84_1189680 [compost metagenome]
MAEAIGLPQGDQFGVALDDAAKHRQVRFGLGLALGKMQFQHMLGEDSLLFGLAGVIEILEMPEAHMARRQAQEHRRTFLGFTPDRRA